MLFPPIVRRLAREKNQENTIQIVREVIVKPAAALGKRIIQNGRIVGVQTIVR